VTAAITVRGLRKAYGGVEAVRGIDVDVEQGEIFALLGPNGAGKTTTVEILEGYRTADGGTVDVLGFDPARGGSAYRARIGIVLQASGVYPFMSVREVCVLFAGFYDAPRPVADVLDAVGLGPQAETRVRKLSGGQRRRLDVALALIGQPEVIFLDEPTTGFDPGARRDAWDMISSLAQAGTTVFLTTHYMDEASVLADRVAVLRRGEVVALGSPTSLIGNRGVRIRFAVPPGSDQESLAGVAGTPVRVEGGVATLEADDPTRALHALTAWALAGGRSLDDLEVVRPTLEDVYLELTDGDPS
jgi:ABC-2 type transport system ATP-binding protein